MLYILISLANQRRILDRLATELNGKMDVVNYDTTPTQGSSNIMTSGSIYNALGHYLNTETLDDITDADIDAMFADTPEETTNVIIAVQLNVDMDAVVNHDQTSNHDPSSMHVVLYADNEIVDEDSTAISITRDRATDDYVSAVCGSIYQLSDMPKNRTYRYKLLSASSDAGDIYNVSGAIEFIGVEEEDGDIVISQHTGTVTITN